MPKKYLSICFLFLTIFSKAQSPDFLWAKQIGGSGGEYINSIKIDASGNVYTTGVFSGTIDFDPGQGVFNIVSSSSGLSQNTFISKLDSSGNFVWAKKIEGSSIVSYSIAIDTSGNIYISGLFDGRADFDPGAPTFYLYASNYDIFILKLNANGNFIWAKGMGGYFRDNCYSISVDDSGNVYTTGSFRNIADFDPGPAYFNLTSAQLGDDIFISKLDASGNFVWAKRFGSYPEDRAYSMAIDNNSNIYITGYFQDTVDFDPGIGELKLASNGFNDIFILKLNSSGNIRWAKQIGAQTNSNDIGYSISCDKSGNVFTTGCFGGTADFDPGPAIVNLTSSGNNSSSDIFISKLDSLGNFKWAVNMGDTFYEQGYSIATDETGSVYTTGFFNGVVDFDPGTNTFKLGSTGSNAAFIAKLDSSGKFVWAKSIVGNSSNYGESIALDNSRNIYATGNFKEKADFDPGIGVFNMTSNGQEDCFLIKLGSCPSINLSIDLTGTKSLKSNQNYASYQWIDCNNGNKPILGETSQVFNAKVTGSYGVIVGMGSCSDTSACKEINVVGLQNNSFINTLSIHPNPTKGIINIFAPNLVNSINVEIYNVLGTLVYKLVSSDVVNTIDLNDQADGLYIIKVINNHSEIAIRRMIKY